MRRLQLLAARQKCERGRLFNHQKDVHLVAAFAAFCVTTPMIVMKNPMTISLRWMSVIFVTAVAASTQAAIDYSSVGSTYSQSFDSLASSGTDLGWTNDTTIPGWSLFRVTNGDNPAPTPMNYYDASDGSANNGRFYSFGIGGDRALGGIGKGTFGYTGDIANNILANATAGWIAASITNNTGTPLTQLTLHYDGEQWRDAGDNGPPYPQTMVFQYGFGSDFASVASWNSPGGSFDFTSPVYTTTDGPVDGNSAGRVAGLGGTIASLSWQAGSTIWLRWVEKNDLAFDHGLAIDNVSFTANSNAAAVPEAGAAAGGILIFTTLGLGWSLTRGSRYCYKKPVKSRNY